MPDSCSDRHLTSPALDMALSGPGELRAARGSLQGLLDARGCETTGDDAGLALSELVANAFRHGVPPVRVVAHLTHDLLVLTVTDAGDGLGIHTAFLTGDHIAAPQPLAEGGRGLWLVARMAGSLTLTSAPGKFRARATFACEPTGLGDDDSGETAS